MKTLNLKLAGVFAFSLLSFSTFAQNWRVGGNTNAQLGGMLQPTLGTNQNRPLLFETNGIGRVLVDNGAGGFAAGRVAMGNNLPNNFAAQDRLHLHQNVRGL